MAFKISTNFCKIDNIPFPSRTIISIQCDLGISLLIDFKLSARVLRDISELYAKTTPKEVLTISSENVADQYLLLVFVLKTLHLQLSWQHPQVRIYSN